MAVADSAVADSAAAAVDGNSAEAAAAMVVVVDTEAAVEVRYIATYFVVINFIIAKVN